MTAPNRFLGLLPDESAFANGLAEIPIETAGHIDDVGHTLVSEEAAKRLKTGWREQMRAATVEDLLPGTLAARASAWAVVSEPAAALDRSAPPSPGAEDHDLTAA